MPHRAAFAGLALVATASACSGDLFHTTDWTPSCEAGTCPSASTQGSGGNATGGTGPQGGSGAEGLGGAGAVGGGVPSTGAGGTGGAGSGGGCTTCSELVLSGSDAPDPSTLCPGASQDAWDALYTCLCARQCENECLDSACVYVTPSSECSNCALSDCPGSVADCQAN